VLIFLVIVCVLFGVVLYGIFSSGWLTGESDGFGFDRPHRLRELSPGCLLSLIVAGSVWFIVWGIVLILALRLLRAPLGD
jgi:hypothetical protein